MTTTPEDRLKEWFAASGGTDASMYNPAFIEQLPDFLESQSEEDYNETIAGVEARTRTKAEEAEKIAASLMGVQNSLKAVQFNEQGQDLFGTGSPDSNYSESMGSITGAGMPFPFAGNYPADMPSTEIKDYIIFSAYSNDVAGYTKFRTVGEGSVGNKECTGTVQLYIPENIAMSSKVNYKNTDGSNAGSLGNAIAPDGTGIGLSVGNLIAQVAGQASALVGESGALAAQVASTTQGGTAVGVGAANRHVLFEGVEFREFSYKYEFLPKSHKESTMIRDIIKFFRIQMLPLVRLNGNTFKPPHYFTVEYIVDGKPSTYLNKIKPCVCTQVDVSYGGNGQFAMIQSEGLEEPAPALINLDLSFQEVQLVSKTDAALGY